MLFKTTQEFFDYTKTIKRISRDQEKEYAKKVQEQGDEEAKQMLIKSYLPVVASCIKRYSFEEPSLDMVYRCIGVLEDAVSKCDFQQDNAFMNTLSFRLRRAMTLYIVNSPK